MGQYFMIVNPSKREYIHPGDFEENSKASGYMLGLHAAAVGILCCDPTQVRSSSGTSLHGYGELAGRWRGDHVYAAGDDYGPPDELGIATATAADPRRNLYALAKEEFANISHVVIAAMCNAHKGDAERFVQRVEPNSVALVRFGQIFFETGSENLGAALVARLGPGWKKLYKEARETHSWLG